MSNSVDMRLDVLATSPEEINKIEAALQEPCPDLLAWVAAKWGRSPKEIDADVKGLVALKPTRNLGYVDPSLNKARRFENDWKDKFWGVAWSHVHFVSRDFPEAIFLAEYWDDCMSYAGKTVIHAGREIRHVHDENQQAQGWEWVLPNIFAPFKAEYELGLECGSLWAEWMEGIRKELAELTVRKSGSNGVETEDCTWKRKSGTRRSRMSDNKAVNDDYVVDAECGELIWASWQ